MRTFYYNITRISCDIGWCLQKIDVSGLVTSSFDSRNVSMGSERSGLTFVCWNKSCSIPVQRYKVWNVCYSDYVSNAMQIECVAIL